MEDFSIYATKPFVMEAAAKLPRLPKTSERAWANVEWCEHCPFVDCKFETLTLCKKNREMK